MTSELEVRKLYSNSEMKLVQELERMIWKGETLPPHQTVTAAANGGLVLGAFLHNELIGFSYSFAGFLNGQVYLCSHNLGIHPDYQVKGIGSRLKEEQRKAALAMGYELITWTFDPLESRNAYLNLTKLHAICNTYVENCYGEVEDGLNKGLPTDRFKVEWWIGSRHVNERLPIGIARIDAHHTFPWEQTDSGLPKLADSSQQFFRNLPESDPVLIPVPVYFQDLKNKDLELANDWRLKTRAIFQTLFAQGFTAAAIKKSMNDPVHYYALVKRESLHVGAVKF